MGIFNFAHGEFVLLGAYTVYLFESSGLGRLGRHRRRALRAGAGRAGAGTPDHPPLLRRPDHRHARHLCHRAVIREIVRGLLGGHYKSIPEPISRRVHRVRLDFSAWRTVIIAHHAASHRRQLAVPARTSIGLQVRGSLENPMLARACGISTDQALRPDLRLRRRAGGPRRRADRAALPALRRYRHALPGAGLPVGHARRRRHLRRARCWAPPRSAAWPPACPGWSSRCWPIRWSSSSRWPS